ncbi:MAG: hypothetical protein RL602_682, partial [Actinomycetota bacterium]
MYIGGAIATAVSISSIAFFMRLSDETMSAK